MNNLDRRKKLHTCIAELNDARVTALLTKNFYHCTIKKTHPS